jgi:hypothetical protein
VTLKRPLFMQAAGGDPTFDYSALDVRALLGMLLRTSGILHALTPGTGALQVTQRGAGANFSVDVAAGAAVISGGDVAGQGMYAVESTATENLAIPSPPVSGTRVHRVIARVKDKLHSGSWTTYEWTLELLPDVGSGTPATPASAISLATVSVAVGQASVLNANITDTRVNALLGPSRPTSVNASTRPLNPNAGEFVLRSDLTPRRWDVYTGTEWRHVDFTSPQRGTGTITLTGASTGSLVVFFPTAFAATPLVLVSIESTSAIDYCHKISSLSPTALEVTIRERTNANVSDTVTVHWEAKIK